MPQDNGLELEAPSAYVDRLGWHEAYSESMRRLESHSSYLIYIAECLEVSGNQALADKLYATAMGIDGDVTVAKLAISKYLADEFAANQASFHETMGTLLTHALGEAKAIDTGVPNDS